VTTLANRRFAQVLGRRAQAGCLIRSTLIFQLFGLKLQPRNSALATGSPMLKGLRVLEEFWWMAEFDHLRTKHVHSEHRLSRRKLVLNRGFGDFILRTRGCSGRWADSKSQIIVHGTRVPSKGQQYQSAASFRSRSR
jgi:hypothetical protein